MLSFTPLRQTTPCIKLGSPTCMRLALVWLERRADLVPSSAGHVWKHNQSTFKKRDVHFDMQGTVFLVYALTLSIISFFI